MNTLTDQQFWDNFWMDIELPAEISPKTNDLVAIELELFDRYLPRKPLTIAEIGGAPGQFLVWMYKRFGYQITCLDYSDQGCLKAEENFRLLNIPGQVIHFDLFKDADHFPLKFDIVYSLGLIEHFDDLDDVVGRHLKILKHEGILILGVPNFQGINHWFMKTLSPDLLSKHNLNSMKIKRWESFEKKFNLQPLFKNYIGGFEPKTFLMRENKTLYAHLLFFTTRVLNKIFSSSYLRFLRKYNSPKFSGYLMGIYKFNGVEETNFPK